MMTSFKEFVGALFEDIQPLSNFDIIRICKKTKINNFKGCVMRDVILNVCGNEECFIMNTDECTSSGTIYYFDSFGIGPIEEIKRYCREPRFYNSFEFSKPNEVIMYNEC